MYKLSFLLLHQPSGGSQNVWKLTTVKQLPKSTGQNSLPQFMRPFAVLQEVQLRRVYSVDLRIFLWRTESMWQLRAEQSTSGIPPSSVADTDCSTFCSFLTQHVISFMAISFTLDCVRISRTGASPGLIHLKLLTCEKFLFEKKITDYNTEFLWVGPVVLYKGGQHEHHTSDEEMTAERHKVTNPGSCSR